MGRRSSRLYVRAALHFQNAEALMAEKDVLHAASPILLTPCAAMTSLLPELPLFVQSQNWSD